MRMLPWTSARSLQTLSLGLATLTITAWSPSVLADTVATAVGPRDSSCVHIVPNGATVNGATGEVSVGGAVITPASASATNCSSGPPGAFSGWEEGVVADAALYDGSYAYSYLLEYFQVPEAPSIEDASISFLFPSFEQCSTHTWGRRGREHR